MTQEMFLLLFNSLIVILSSLSTILIVLNMLSESEYVHRFVVFSTLGYTFSAILSHFLEHEFINAFSITMLCIIIFFLLLYVIFSKLSGD